MSDAAALRPLGVGDILDEAFRIYRENFGYLVVVGIAAFGPVAIVVALLSGIGVALASGAGALEAVPLVIGVVAVLGGLLTALAGVVELNAMIYAIDGLRRGRRPAISQVLVQALGRVPAMIGLTLLVTVVVMLLFFTIVGWLWAAVLWSMAFPVLIIEGGGIMRALSRSRQLVRGTWWRVFGILALIWIISAFISFGIAAIGGTVAALLIVAGDSTPVEVASLILRLLFNVAAQALSQPFVVAGMVLLYYDLRVRKEGLDLQERAESLLPSEAPASPA
jgi:hypothetical protein